MADVEELTRWLARLENDQRDRERRVRQMEITLARFPDLEDDIKETASNCKAIREWVEQRDQQKEALTAGQRAAIIAGAFALAASFVALIGTLIAAGVI